MALPYAAHRLAKDLRRKVWKSRRGRRGFERKVVKESGSGSDFGN